MDFPADGSFKTEHPILIPPRRTSLWEGSTEGVGWLPSRLAILGVMLILPGGRPAEHPILIPPRRTSLWEGSTEGGGFEPTILSDYGFQDRRLRPLGHPSDLYWGPVRKGHNKVLRCPQTPRQSQAKPVDCLFSVFKNSYFVLAEG